MNIIDIRNLVFSYHTKGPVTLRISKLQIETGEKVFLHGPSGSGKSTLLGVLTGMLDTKRRRGYGFWPKA